MRPFLFNGYQVVENANLVVPDGGHELFAPSGRRLVVKRGGGILVGSGRDKIRIAKRPTYKPNPDLLVADKPMLTGGPPMIFGHPATIAKLRHAMISEEDLF